MRACIKVFAVVVRLVYHADVVLSVQAKLVDEDGKTQIFVGARLAIATCSDYVVRCGCCFTMDCFARRACHPTSCLIVRLEGKCLIDTYVGY
jgi:hypothetical protein